MSNDLGIDRSGNGNNFTVNNMAFSDQVLDSPTNNFCTINPLDVQTVDKLKEGNLYANSGPARCRGTMAVSSGKWYYELLLVYQHHGTADIGIRGVGGNKISVDTGNDFVRMQQPYNSGISINVGGSVTGDLNNGVVQGGSGDSAPGSIIGVMWDMDAETITFKSNNSALDSALTDIDFSGVSNMETVAPHFAINGGRTAVANFGQDSSFAGLKTAQGNQDSNDIGDFYYTPPTGYLALCTKNLPDVAVTPSEHFNTLLYTGNGGTGNHTGVGFQPDFVWIKGRNVAENHALHDAVRGTSAGHIRSDTTNAESTNEHLLEYGTDGFNFIGGSPTSAAGHQQVNSASYNYVAWNWKANGSGSSNTAGSINSTVSVNTDAGFSIVSYTGNATAGATVGHGLSSSPEMVITKQRANTGSWQVLTNVTPDYTEGDYLYLNDTVAVANSANVSFLPTSTTWEMEAGQQGNVASSQIAYCFHSVDGYSKVGSYVGNASDDAPFVYTGFRPAWVMYKKATGAAGWFIHDSARDPENIANQTLSADATTVEYTSANAGTALDLLSNGFNLGGAGGDMNGNNETYIYIAFAEAPFKFANAR